MIGTGSLARGRFLGVWTFRDDAAPLSDLQSILGESGSHILTLRNCSMNFGNLMLCAFGLVTIVTIYYLFLRNPGGSAVVSKPQ